MIKSKLSEEIESYMTSTKDTQLNSTSILDITSAILQKHAKLTLTELQSIMEASEQMITSKIEKSRILNDCSDKNKCGK